MTQRLFPRIIVAVLALLTIISGVFSYILSVIVQAHNSGAITASACGAAGSMALLIWFAVYLYRAMVRPVRDGAFMASRLASGDLATRMPETGRGEVGELQRSFNTMGASLERRRDEQAALRRVATLVAHSVPSSEVFAAVAEEVGHLLDADGTRLFRFEADGTATVLASWGTTTDIPCGKRVPLDGQNIPAQVRETGHAVRIDDLTTATGTLAEQLRASGVRSGAGTPITVETHTWGAITALSTREQPLPPNAETRFAELAELAGTTIANSQNREDLVDSRARLVTASDQARLRIERNLHDGVQQRLVSLTLDLRSVGEDLPDRMPQLKTELSRVADGLANTLDELREVSRGIHPAVLTEAGLGPALRALARRSTLPVDIDLRFERRLPPYVEVAAYYVLAEGLTNATKHAHATHLRVSAFIQDQQLHFTVQDNGVGGADTRKGSGLLGLHDRIEAINGTLHVSSPIDHGTSLEVSLPLDVVT